MIQKIFIDGQPFYTNIFFLIKHYIFSDEEGTITKTIQIKIIVLSACPSVGVNFIAQADLKISKRCVFLKIITLWDHRNFILKTKLCSCRKEKSTDFDQTLIFLGFNSPFGKITTFFFVYRLTGQTSEEKKTETKYLA